MVPGPITSWQIEEEKVKVVTDFLFLGSKTTVGGDCSHETRRWLLIGRKTLTKLDSVLKSSAFQRHCSADKGLCSQGYGLSSGHIHLWELGHKEGRMPKNWCLWMVVLEKTPEGLLDSKEIKPVNLKGNQTWILSGRTNAKAEVTVFWSYDMNNQLIGKVPDAGKDWGQKEKRASEEKMAGWHHQWNGHELGQTLGDGEGQGSLACCSPWGCKELDMTEWLNKNNKLWWINFIIIIMNQSILEMIWIIIILVKQWLP